MARNYWLPRTEEDDPNRDLFEDRYYTAGQYVAGLVVDAACGYGSGSQMLWHEPGVRHVIGIDVNNTAIDAAKANQTISDHAINGSRGVEYIVADLEKDELPECDWVVTLETVEHLLCHLEFLGEAKKKAKAGIVISTPIVPVAHRKGNFHDFTQAEVDSWFPGWELVHGQRIKAEYSGKIQDVYYLGVYTK